MLSLIKKQEIKICLLEILVGTDGHQLRQKVGAEKKLINENK